MSKQKYEGYIGRTVFDTDLHAIEQPKTERKPNVLYILLDDMGFSHLGCYGSNIETPNIDSLAKEGLRYNNFHTTAICSATRASLLTGANHHATGVNAVIESFTVPGSKNSIGHVSNEYATIAEILKEHDYATFLVGKWHLTPLLAVTQSGPYGQWPLSRGFDKFYGFMHGMCDQFNPELIRDNTPVYQQKSAADGYHITEDLADNAIEYIQNQVNAYPEQPFFLYFAPGAMHAPHHVPLEYADRYKGKFDAGWDKIRDQWYESQKKLGIIPENAELTPRNELVPAWDTLSNDQKRLYARYMEVYAGFLTHTDEQIGRIIDYLRRLGELDNTIIVFLSDNGASSEGGQEGRFNEQVSGGIFANKGDFELGLENIELIGTEFSHNHYPIGWANAGNTPFPWYKSFVHSGGVKDPLIIRYPAATVEAGGVRGQYHHVSDITPAVLELLNIEKPEVIKGNHLKDMTGTSLAYTLSNPDAPTKKRVQYYEITGNRAIWKDGWKAVVSHVFNKSYADDIWELYHTDEDYSEAENVADKYPEKLKELQEEWLVEAGKNNVFPLVAGSYLTNWSGNLDAPANEFEGTYRLIKSPFDLPVNRVVFDQSFAVTAEIDRIGEGVIFSSGDRHAGFALYIFEGHLTYSVATGQRKWYAVKSKSSVPNGKSTVSVVSEKIEDKENITLYINGKVEATLEIPKQLPAFMYGPVTIGANKFTSVSEDYESPFNFNGEVTKLKVHIAPSKVNFEDLLERFFAAD